MFHHVYTLPQQTVEMVLVPVCLLVTTRTSGNASSGLTGPRKYHGITSVGVTRAAQDAAGKGVDKGKGKGSKAPSGQTPYTISVTVTRGGYGYGFSVAWTRPPRVEAVDPGSPAAEAGLMPGDYIIFVGHHNIVKAEENQVLEMIKECGDTLPLEVYRRGVSKPPRGLANGTTSSLVPPSEHHPRNKLSHISFTSEDCQGGRQAAVYALINCEQAFSNACRFGIERYLIPLKFRTDLLTQTEHEDLFNNMDQLVDLSELLIDRMMGNSEVSIGEDVGKGYYILLDELTEHYACYMGGLPEADKVLAIKYQEADFKEFLQVPQVPRKKPDITTFIHKPAEVYTSEPSHQDNTYLDAVLDKLKTCYRGVTSQQNIMEPSPHAPPLPARPPDAATSSTAPITPPITLTSPAHSTQLRPPLVSVADIEKRLVFTKYTQPFKLNDGVREWVFGGELHKFEGRHLREYWAMLFSDLLLFTKINRDRVIFVMEDPVPIAAVCQACFTVKKKDSRVKVSGGSGSGYLTNTNHHKSDSSSSSSGGGSLRGHKKTLVLRAPTIDLKATWNNLIRRQL
ncbi:hypothetical protein Pmani_016711 [Petrolisthes manimaculis]|uniref:PDZ domain-containing protein n=1 Tax=Petrolisthes manimaculis TaxID=1843537 RepID=A0AAE1PR14_9EUCA|nr:hypothetical protein Pmani_016711 [Petrolisthes manimaculis]